MMLLIQCAVRHVLLLSHSLWNKLLGRRRTGILFWCWRRAWVYTICLELRKLASDTRDDGLESLVESNANF